MFPVDLLGIQQKFVETNILIAYSMKYDDFVDFVNVKSSKSEIAGHPA